MDRVGGAEVLQRAQGTTLAPTNAPNHPRAAVGPPIPHLPSARAPTPAEAKTLPPLFFFITLVVLDADPPDRFTPRSVPGRRLKLR